MVRHPTIGLNMSFDLIDKYEKYGLLVPVGYVDAVEGAGGVALCIPPCADITMIDALIPLLDGVVLIGGDDYWPDHFGGHPQPENELMPRRRDIFDLTLAKKVLHHTDLPVLGICGGHQLLSIAQGGSLIQDIKTEWTSPPCSPYIPHSRKERPDDDTNFRHPVGLEAGSLVARAVNIPGGGIVMTNSSHHQAVDAKRIGTDMRASAWTEDGIIEAIEPAVNSLWALSGRFILGVEWHPEQMQDEEPHRNIFRAFVEAAQKKRSL
ncbi:MAG TPA: gamma-glutamyl-gamma-aminobutyrate hydrolase family protein [Syntrophales bacterium]|nr:gamma-glutamyl-gamma-aminobutyrate hydrolase family protein [Syntrophales bacterium]